MEQLGPLPGPDTVLNKLKSDGTFDQFRKSCLAAIESEPSFRAHGEHMEVMSRRYLQNIERKAGITRNEARAKLKSYALGVIANPELQVGMPLGALVEKALEAKGQELLPKIADAIDALRAFKPPPPSETSQVSAPVTAGATAAGLPTTISEGAPGDTNKLKGSDLREFPLPIEIPGLTAPKKDKDSVAGGGADTTTATANKTSGKVAKGKQLESSGAKETTKSLKSNETPTMTGVGAAGSSSLKEGGKGGLQLKEKTAASSATGKFTGAKEGGKPRPEKEEKVSGGNKDADKEVLSEEGKEKVKAIQKPKKHAKVEVARDKQSAGHRDTPEVGKASSRLAPASKEKEKGNETRMESSSGEQKNPSKSTHRETSKTEYGFDDDISESTSNSSKGTEKAQHIDDEVTEPQPGKQQESAPTGSRKRKQLPPMRRSARLASFKDEDEKDEEAEVKPQDERLPRKGKGAAAGTGGSDGDSEVSELGEEEPQRRVGKRQLERGKGKASARKKPRILSSSSEEERSESEDKEVEASLFSHEDEKCSKRPRTIRKRRLTLDSDSEAPKTKTISRKRARSQAQGDSSASSSAAKGPKGKVTREEQGSKTSMSKNRSQRLTSPVVVTRYNRRVKPNRRYTPSEDISNSGTSDEGADKEEEGEVDGEGEGGKMENKDEMVVEFTSSGSEEDIPQSVRARTKTGHGRARKY